MFLLISIYIASIAAYLIHVFSLEKFERTKKRLVELLLQYQIVFSIGLTSFLAFIGFTFLPEYIAKITDWPYCPFEQQMGNVNLAFGVLGVMAIWYRGGFWTATVLGFSIWIFSDGIHHIWLALTKGNYTSGNVGVPLITDLLIPTILVILLIWNNRLNQKG